MTSRLSKLLIAAAVAASLPAAAAAHDCDPGRHGREHAARLAPWHAQPPAPHRWRHASWRERKLHEIRAKLHALDARRAAFHARFAWNPRMLRRYDRVHFERRAALERRWFELQLVAWR